MKTIRNWLMVALAALALPAAAGTYSDLWYNPQESGWGMNVVQQGETAFVTLFVYGPDGKPAWYVASDARAIAFDSAGRPLFSGTLYRTEGPWQGAPFDPSKLKVTPAGTISLGVVAFDRMQVEYTADGVGPVTKTVVRQTWAVPAVHAFYSARFIMREALPGQTSFGTRVYSADLTVSFENSQAFIRVEDELGVRCDYRGPFVQAGKLARATGTFACTGGDSMSGTFELTDFEVTDHGITGFLRTAAPTLNTFGRFAAAHF